MVVSFTDEYRMMNHWNIEQNKAFENALALFDDEDAPDRWENISTYVPGNKTPAEVKHHYDILLHDLNSIENGLVPIPQYSSSSYVPDWLSPSSSASDNNSCDLPNNNSSSPSPFNSSSARPTTSKPSDERKKGVPWTEEEHRLFLMGLNKYGKGDWRSISRNFVVSRTPTQVASHAQKYFLRLSSANKEKKRSSIHDITNVGVVEMKQQSNPSSNASYASPNMVINPGIGIGNGITSHQGVNHGMHGNLNASHMEFPYQSAMHN